MIRITRLFDSCSPCHLCGKEHFNLLTNFIHDIRCYSVGTAFFNMWALLTWPKDGFMSYDEYYGIEES